MAAVTANDSAHAGSDVTCHGCDRTEAPNRKWGFGEPHCSTCHADGHRACAHCGTCLPKGHRWDRYYCSSTCRVRGKQQRDDEALERAVWEAEHPEAAAEQRAAAEAADAHLAAALGMLEAAEPGARSRLERTKRHEQIQDRADRCAECDKPFAAGDTIYRRSVKHSEGLVLPYCAEHRCGQPDGRHNRDLDDGYHYKWCRCPGGMGDRAWMAPAPCAYCSRLVCNDRRTANPWKFVREWAKFGETGELRVRMFCSNACRRAVNRVEAKAKRLRDRQQPRCECCRREFAGRADSHYCSRACRQRAYRQRRKAVA